MKHFKDIKSFEDLKNQFKALARKNHPDAGGDPEVMKAINGEYDQLFPIWKYKYNVTAPEPTKETADSTRSEFYTAYGWKGSKHDWSRSTKEVASLIRTYVKEIYPTYKFSIRYSHASMCSEIHIELKEAPHGLYKNYDELTKDDINNIHRQLRANHLFNKDSWFDHELKTAILEAWDKSDFYKVYNDGTSAVIEDVNREVNSYNYNDCDAMTDYFHVDFYYFGCKVSSDFKVVEKTARINNASSQTKTEACKEIESIDNNCTYDIAEDTDTRDNSKIWVVKVVEKLDREEYIKVNQYMKSIGGYYSRFKHGFIFKSNPIELLNSDLSSKPEAEEYIRTETPPEEPKEKVKPIIEYDIMEDKSPFDNKKVIYIVKVKNELSKQEFAEVKRELAKIQGYHSSLKDGFIFKYDPTEKLIV